VILVAWPDIQKYPIRRQKVGDFHPVQESWSLIRNRYPTPVSVRI
jgi:hypothetical protein